MNKLLFLLLFITYSAFASDSISTKYFGTTLYIGETEKNLGTQRVVYSLEEYVEFFGLQPAPIIDLTYLSVRAYFQHGGQALLVSSIETQSEETYALALENSKDIGVELVIAPNLVLATESESVTNIYRLLIEHVEASKNRFLIMDAPALLSKEQLLVFRRQFSSKRAALYAPWAIAQSDQLYKLVPSSSLVAGTMMRLDRERGVYKPPAGPNARLNVVGLAQAFSVSEQNELNENRVNLLRSIDSLGGFYIWGARNLGEHPVNRYVSTSRLLTLLDYSISSSLEAIDFDWTQPHLNREIEGKVEEFLYSYWIQGTFPGQKTSDSYFVRCTPIQQNIECLIGISLLRPREFEIIRITHFR